jgi:hypothetical protein
LRKERETLLRCGAMALFLCLSCTGGQGRL